MQRSQPLFGFLPRVTLANLARFGIAAFFALTPALSAGDVHAAPSALRILHTTPLAGATDVPASGFISIAFDQPVVSLGQVGVAGADPAAVISPPVAGKGRWINSSIWAYQLAGGLALATQYTVTTRADLAAQDGSRLPGSYSFSFATLRPGVVSVTPTNQTLYALPTDAMQVVFNQPVRHASAERAFTAQAGGQRISGHFTWNDKLLATQPNGSGAVVPAQSAAANQGPPPLAKDMVMTFHPSASLPLGAQVQVAEGPGVRGQSGALPMVTPYSWRYGVAGPLAVSTTDPANGSSSVDLSNGLKITLSAPVTQAAANRAIHVSPKLSYQYISVDDTGINITINGDFQPSTGYTVRIDSSLRGTARQALARPMAIAVVTQSSLPSVSLVRQGGPAAVYNAYLGANIYARVVNLANVPMSLYRLSAAQFRTLAYNPPQNWSGQPPAGAPLVANWLVPSKAPQNKSILVRQRLQVNGRDVSPGYYLVNAGPGNGGGNGSDHLLVLITHTSVTLKIGQHEAFAWATDLKTGKPVAGESVQVLDNKGHIWASGVTGHDGVFQAPVTGLRGDDSLLSHTIIAQLVAGSEIAACGLDWNNGVGPWDFNLPFNSYQPPIRLYMTTERPIYRPGQSVYFKGIARRDNDGRYALPPVGTPIQVQVQDARQSTIFNVRLHMDAYGAFSGKLLLSPAASLGSYSINAGVGASSNSIYFQVAEYKKPSYAVTVISDRGANANYAQGEHIGVQVRANYYFGAPLTHAPVKWDLTQDDFFFTSPLFPEYNFVDNDYVAVQQQTFFGQQITEGTGTTDAHGDFHFSVPANLGKHPVSQQYTLEAIVTGPDSSQIAERTQAVVHKAALYIGLRPVDYVGVAGKPSVIRAVTVADDGNRVIGNAPVSVNIYRRIWLSSYVRDSNGFYFWQDSHKDSLERSIITHTGANGQASFSFTPSQGGEYRIVAITSDAAGHANTSSLSLWVVAVGSAYVPWAAQNNDRIRLVADKQSYKPGDTAHILVTAPLAGMTALVTVERGSVLSHRVITLPTNSTQIAVPILGYYAPDVYVSVTLVKGPGADTAIPVWKLGYVALPVDTSARSLHVAISGFPVKARPGQVVSFIVHTSDSQGHGVPAQLAVSLVDKAVLALAQNGNTGLMDTYYQKRELGVESAGSLTLYIDRLNLNQKVGSKGGSGGGGGGQGPTRKQFPDTAYWNPAVVSDANGNARVTITLPDNLTTWTFAAIGGTAGTLVGQSSADLISSKDLLLEPALPRFLTVGDTTSGGAVVNNLTTKAQQVTVTLQTVGATFKRAVNVAAGGSQLVQWPVQATVVGNQTFLFSAQAQDASLNDRLQISLPVEPSSLPTVQSTTGLFRTTVTEHLHVPTGAQTNQGDLTISLAPSLVSGLQDAARFLAAYAYDCAEQTTSRAIGLVQVARLPVATSGVGASLLSSVPGTAQAALQRLYNTQNSDGGWGWWPEDLSAPFMSAYVLEGLTLLRAQGYSVDAGVLRQAKNYLRTWTLNPPAVTYLPDATSTLDLRAYSAYVLGEAGSPDAGITSDLYMRHQNMLPFARAYLALALARVSSASDPRVRTLLSDLAGAAQQIGNQAHWSDASPDWTMMDSKDSATAIALDALVRLDPANPLTLATTRWLMTQRIDDAWDSTRSTALVLKALVDFSIHVQPPSAGATQIGVAVNGVAVGHSNALAIDRIRGATFTVPLSALGASGTGIVSLRQIGSITPIAYTITLHTYQPVTKIGAAEHGIMVTRRYEPIAGGHGQTGSDLRVVLTLTAPVDLQYLVLEDPLPAGAEPVDPSLRTTSVLSGITSQTTIPRGTSDLGWYISHVELRDDRAALFADYVPAGVYQYSYQLHLTSAGAYHALPAQAHLLYFPDVSGHSGGSIYTITAH